MRTDILEKLKLIGKDYYTLKEIAFLYKGSFGSLKIALNRLKKSNKIKKIQRNIYILPEKLSNIEKIANQIYSPSYLSFESALSFWGILSQIPYNLTFATSKKTKKLNLENQTVEYRKINKKLFGGYRNIDGLYMAEPEKALLDTIYLASLGKLKINFENFDLAKINKINFLSWVKKSPQKTKNFIKKSKTLQLLIKDKF